MFQVKNDVFKLILGQNSFFQINHISKLRFQVTNSQAHLDMDTEKCIFLIAIAVECSNFLLTPLDTDASTATMLAHPSCKYCETILRNIFEIIFTFAIGMRIIGKR